MKPRQILLCLVLSTLVDILVLPRDGLQCCFQYVNIKTTKRARRQARLPGKRVPRLDGVRQLAASTANGASADQGRLDDPMRKRRCTEERTPPRRGCRGRRRDGPALSGSLPRAPPQGGRGCHHSATIQTSPTMDGLQVGATERGSASTGSSCVDQVAFRHVPLCDLPCNYIKILNRKRQPLRFRGENSKSCVSIVMRETEPTPTPTSPHCLPPVLLYAHGLAMAN